MAKYDITYACGHQGTVSLFGKGSERDRKRAWLATVNCRECEAEAHDHDPIKFEIAPYSMATDDDGFPLMQLILSGGTRPRKEEIKALGYRFDEVQRGGMSLLSCTAPPKAWIKIVRLDEEVIATAAKETCDALGIDSPDLTVDPISLQIARNQVTKATAQKAAIAEITKPARPDCHPLVQHPDADRWNGKIYGRPGNYNYYLNDTKYTLTDAEHDQIQAYQSARAEYLQAVADIKAAK